MRFGLSDHLKALLDFVFGSRRRVKKVRIFRAWFSHFEKLAAVAAPMPSTACSLYSVTVKNSGGETRTRCVTSCAGSTAFLSVVAQTRRGFLSGGSARQTANLNDVEKDIQLEEAYARATVALTRARRLCVLLCPLDQKGPIGAATILGCLQYGLGYLQHSFGESREC